MKKKQHQKKTKKAKKRNKRKATTLNLVHAVVTNLWRESRA
jgi:hypothetical protein